MKVSKKQQGFTIIELLIVVVVIGILTGLVFATFSGVNQKIRNTERKRDIEALHGQVEAYYESKGNYPTLANLNDSTWRASNMKGLDNDVFKDPKGSSDKLAAAPDSKVYSYEVKASDDSACDNNPPTGKDCAKYVLTATYEAGPIYTKSNLN